MFMFSFNFDYCDHQWKKKLQAQKIFFFSTKCGGIVHK